MPRNHGKLKIRWIVQKAARKATFQKRRATLLEKAKELSILCQIPVAMVVYGPGNAEPVFWPEDLDEAKGIMRRYLELPEASKERLDNEGFLRQALKKVGKRFESYKATARQLEVNLILNDISLARRSNLDDLAPELAAAVKDIYHYDVAITPESVSWARNRWIIKELISLHKQHLDWRPPVYDGRKSLFTAGPLPFKSKEFVLNLTDPERASQGEREYRVAILDDGGRRQATDEDVDRLLWERGLESFIKPKPM